MKENLVCLKKYLIVLNIYKLDVSNFKSGQTGWSAEVVSGKDEEVLEVEYIENVYEELVKLNKEGLIKLYLYPEKPNRIPQDNSDLISKVINWKKMDLMLTNFTNYIQN